MGSPIDRSLAFTALLDQGQFAGVESKRGEQMVTVFLHDYYRSVDRYKAAEQQFPTMYEFARTWEMHDVP
jgi:hypothetical protein